MATNGGSNVNAGWLKSCYEQTLLPNSVWNDKIYPKLYWSFAERIRHDLESELDTMVEEGFDKELCKQMIFHLVGAQFVQQHFLNETIRTQLVKSSDFSEHQRRLVRKRCLVWLQYTLALAADECGCARLSDGALQSEGVRYCEEMYSFLDETSRIFQKGLEVELHKLEIPQSEKLHPLNRMRKNGANRKVDDSVADDDLTEGILRENDDPDRVLTNTNRSGGQRLSGPQSDMIGGAIRSLLSRDHSRIDYVLQKLQGQLLPQSLRDFVWLHTLLHAERQKSNNARRIERTLKERFARAVTHRLRDLNISSVDESLISEILPDAVYETYKTVTSMRGYLNDARHIDEAVKTLNILYVHSHVYEPHFIYWLFPLQLAFQNRNETGDNSLELALSMDLFMRDVFPGWPAIQIISENVMAKLQAISPKLYNHIRLTLCVDPDINGKEFSFCLINMPKSEANELLHSFNTESNNSARPLLAEPTMFINKWIGEMFVGVLDAGALMFVLDQCFLRSWQHDVVEQFCLAILLLLQEKFLHAHSFSDTRQVFLSEPCKLYTKDIRSAWIQLQQNGDLRLIPAMNRLSLVRPESADVVTPRSEPLVQEKESVVPQLQQRELGTLQRGQTQILSDSNSSFDVYIDGLTNLPDRATIVKVTGCIVNGGDDLDLSPNIAAYPDLDSLSRSPSFTFRQTYNESSGDVNGAATLLLRVYTVTSDTLQLVILGDCAFDLFNRRQKYIRTGSYMKCLHVVNSRELVMNPEELQGDSFDNEPVLPAARIYFRILKHSEEYMTPGLLSDVDYTRLDAPLNDSELRIIEGVEKRDERDNRPRTVSDMISWLQDRELEATDREAIGRSKPKDVWMRERLDLDIQLPDGSLPPHISLDKMVGYEQESGIIVNIIRAYGLDPGKYIFCSAVAISSSAHSSEESLLPGWTSGDTVYVSRVDLNSQQASPQWLDEPQRVLAPVPYAAVDSELGVGDASYLLITLYGIDVVYKPSANHASPGRVVRYNGAELNDLQDLIIGWTIVSLTYRGFVCTGEHHVPIFKGRPNQHFLRRLTTQSITDTIRSMRWNTSNKYAKASLVVNIWDGQLSEDISPDQLERNDDLLVAATCRDACLSAEKKINSYQVNQFIHDPINRLYKSRQERKRVYQQECRLFEASMQRVIDILTANIYHSSSPTRGAIV